MKIYIVDFDGTLVDSHEVWADVDRKYFAELGIAPPENLNEIIKSMSFVQYHR